MGVRLRFGLVASIAVLTAMYWHSVQAQEGKIVPYVPTPQEVVDRMLDLAQVKKGDVVYDLGFGRWADRRDCGKKIRCQGDRL